MSDYRNVSVNSDYRNVSVKKDGITYISGAAGKDRNDASQILVWGGTNPNQLTDGDTYLLTGSGGLDTKGSFQGGEGFESDPWVFENVE